MTEAFAWDPWSVVAGSPELTVQTAVPLPAGERGRYYQEQDVILLSRGLDQTERRVTLTHELVHRMRGHSQCATAELEARQELACEKEAARLLISIGGLADALLWALTLQECADELWVDMTTLQTRLDHLHPAERGFLKRRLAMKEHTA